MKNNEKRDCHFCEELTNDQTMFCNNKTQKAWAAMPLNSEAHPQCYITELVRIAMEEKGLL